jgi:hypothetical protein
MLEGRRPAPSGQPYAARRRLAMQTIKEKEGYALPSIFNL